jgi:predicted MFS family arabinose efflux permease
MVAVGVLFGACEVAVTAAGDSAGGPAAAAPLLGLWGIGSVLGGMVASRIRRGLPLPVLLAALALGHGALLAAPGGGGATALVLFLAGTAIAPTYGTLYALVDAAAPAASATEAFAWIATAASIGGAAGSAAAGALSESAGPGAAFALAGVAGAVACLTALTGRTAPAARPAVAAATATA